MQVIAYQNQDGGVSIVYPMAGFSVDDVSGVVPPGVVWFQIDAADLPQGNRSDWKISGGAVVSDPEAGKQKRRASAVIDRTAFCIALRRLQILPISEAVAAARGEWPASFAAFAAALPADQSADVQIRWAAATEIHYSDPTLQALALAATAGSAPAATTLLDQIFGL